MILSRQRLRFAGWLGGVVASAILGGAPVAFADAAEFIAACTEASNMEAPLCGCIEGKASAELSPTGYEFVIAALREDDKKTDELRKKLPPMELMQAGMFLANAPGRCAKEMGGS